MTVHQLLKLELCHFKALLGLFCQFIVAWCSEVTMDGVGWRYPVPAWGIAGKLHRSGFVHFELAGSSPHSSSVLRGRVRIHCQNLHSCKSNIILRQSAWGDRRGREDWLTPSLTQCLPWSRRNLPTCWAFIHGSKLAISGIFKENSRVESSRTSK